MINAATGRACYTKSVVWTTSPSGGGGEGGVASPPPDGDVVHTTLFVYHALPVAALITLTAQEAWLSPSLRKNTRTALSASLFRGVTLMKPSWSKGSTLNGPFVLVNNSWGEARPGWREKPIG